MALREISVSKDFMPYAEGSCLIAFGNTKVICTASVEKKVPPHIDETVSGWLTAEYAMLPRSTQIRNKREGIGKVNHRGIEIQRLIGRSLRQAVDLTKIPGFTITVDCDVLQADGGTRTAAITGGCIAVYDAIQTMQRQGLIAENAFRQWIAAVSAGIVAGAPVVDLDYEKDSRAEVDFNIVMTEDGNFVELQGTGEHGSFSRKELNTLLALSRTAIKKLIKIQKRAVGVE
ncbi:MAG TPA: ribonuclease PH [Candidatus Cloacimonadota bacterium]|nr:ribonuclease PH [Candidatus Cloacimonadota bacterium]HQL14391.1 ribonuclease PH [Candidatus Cloacimonadota bacterium]